MSSVVKYIFSIILILYIGSRTYSQDIKLLNSPDGKDVYRIKWVSQFPPTLQDNKQSVFQKAFNFFFGKTSLVPSKPVSVIAIDKNKLWVIDQGNRVLFKIHNLEIELPESEIKDNQRFSSMVGLCSMNKETILFTDSRENKIYKYTEGSRSIIKFNDSLDLKQPTGIAYSKATNEIWVVETAAHRVSILNEQGNIVKVIGERGNEEEEFNYPTFIWIDDEGTSYIVDALNFRIKLYNPDGTLISTFGEAGDATGYLARPKGLATDSHGNIYVVDALFHVVQIFDRKGNFLYYFGNQGQGKGEFWMPSGIYIDKDDYIYVADSYNSRIQIFQLIREPNYDNN